MIANSPTIECRNLYDISRAGPHWRTCGLCALRLEEAEARVGCERTWLFGRSAKRRAAVRLRSSAGSRLGGLCCSARRLGELDVA